MRPQGSNKCGECHSLAPHRTDRKRTSLGHYGAASRTPKQQEGGGSLAFNRWANHELVKQTSHNVEIAVRACNLWLVF